MKRQRLLAADHPSTFHNKVNNHLTIGWKVVPGCIFAKGLWSGEEHFFSATVWRDGVETMVTAECFKAFTDTINQYLKNGYYIVIGSLYATSLGSKKGAKGLGQMQQYFFNVVGEE